MKRSKLVLDRLTAQRAELEKANPNLKFYECKPHSFIDLKPDNIKTSGYWRLEGRRVKEGEKPVAYVVSGNGGKSPWGVSQCTEFKPAYDISQTEEL